MFPLGYPLPLGLFPKTLRQSGRDFGAVAAAQPLLGLGQGPQRSLPLAADMLVKPGHQQSRRLSLHHPAAAQQQRRPRGEKGVGEAELLVEDFEMTEQQAFTGAELSPATCKNPQG